jgi:3-oxoadipate CoA-transferase beta subunit
MMSLLTKSGESKIVEQCTYPLTAPACVSRIYSDMAVFEVTTEGLAVLSIVGGLQLSELQALTGVDLLNRLGS